jgi:dTDP-4-amino-4,6-dideoxygalactose transaminase
MTYVPADPLLDLATLRKARRGGCGGSGLPPNAIFLEWGRTALWAALRALTLRPGDRVLLPAYICDSILPTIAALGLEVRYLKVDRTLRLDLDDLERELADGARAVLVVHYFGFPAADLERIAELCAGYGSRLIEDCAHALFSQHDGKTLGQRGAAAIFSPWKSLPLPDGGLLALNDPTLSANLSRLGRPPAVATAARLAYNMLPSLEAALGFSPRLWLVRSRRFRSTLQARAAQATFVPRRASSLAESIAAGADAALITSRRRMNYLRLEQALRGSRWARPLFEQLPDGVCPLGFSILVEEREAARQRLLAAGVNVRAYWEQLPAAVPVEAFDDAHYVANRILVLPVHQSLSSHQMDHLLHTLNRLESR